MINTLSDDDSGGMMAPAKTEVETVPPPPSATATADEDDSVGMGKRAHTVSEGVPVHAEPIFFPDNYSAYLTEPPLNGQREALDRHRLASLRKPFRSAEDEAMFLAPFELWRTADRRPVFPGWRCAVPNATVQANLHLCGSQDIIKKISVFRGPVTALALDAIVNAANEGCLGGGGVDGAIHDAAGPLLHRECCTFSGCETGQTRITKGYNLPARFVLHAVGPMGERPLPLASCYRSALQLARHHKLRSVGFCCISTGIFGYPLAAATRVALHTCLSFLNEHSADFDVVVFACFRRDEEECYKGMVNGIYREVLSGKQETASAAPRKK